MQNSRCVRVCASSTVRSGHNHQHMRSSARPCYQEWADRVKRELPEALAFEFPENWESPITDFCTDDTAARDFQQAEDAAEQSDAERQQTEATTQQQDEDPEGGR